MKFMRAKRYFPDVILNLKSEEVKSEFQRSYLLIFLFSIILIVSIINFFLVNETIVKFYGGATAFLTIVVFVVVFLFYQMLVLQYLKQKLRRGTGTSTAYKFIHTTIEISFATAIILYMVAEK